MESERTQNPWMGADQNPSLQIHSQGLSVPESPFSERDGDGGVGLSKNLPDGKLGIAERAFSAAGAAFLSAIIVNPLDVAKV